MLKRALDTAVLSPPTNARRSRAEQPSAKRTAKNQGHDTPGPRGTVDLN